MRRFSFPAPTAPPLNLPLSNPSVRPTLRTSHIRNKSFLFKYIRTYTAFPTGTNQSLIAYLSIIQQAIVLNGDFAG